MLEILKIVLLSIVQGITVLLPVSSLGHFSLLKEVLGYTDENFNASFYYALFSLSAVLALYIYYAKMHKKILSNMFKSKNKIKNEKEHAYKVAGRNILLSLAPLAVLAIPTSKSRFVGSMWTYFLSDGSLLFVGIASIFCSIFMFISIWYLKQNTEHKTSLLEPKNAVMFGIFQIPAYIFPGLSHVAVGASRTSVCDIETKNVFKEAFLYITPAYLVVNLFRVIYYAITVGGINIIASVIGFVISFIISFLVLGIVNKFFNSRAYTAFTIYTLVFGVLVTATSLIQMLA